MIRTILIVSLLLASSIFAEIPAEEKRAIAFLEAKGMKLIMNDDGHVVRLTHSGQPTLTPAEYGVIGQLTELEAMGLNATTLKEGEWGFLHELPKLKQLSIWHGKGFANLKPFSDLPLESLTVGGCMGLRDFNKETPEKQRDAILTLEGLPNVKKLNLYHNPLGPTDEVLKHLAEEFPTLEDLRLDVLAPRGFETTITPEGVRALQALPLRVVNLENASSFGPEHLKALASIETLEAFLVDARKKPGPSEEAIAAFREARPEVVVVVANPGDKPPAVPRKPKG